MVDPQASRRDILATIAAAGSAGAFAGSGAVSLFTDEETFTDNSIQASNSVAGVIDLTVNIEQDQHGIVFELSLPETDDTDEELNNNPSRVWVRTSCAEEFDDARNTQIAVSLVNGPETTIVKGTALAVFDGDLNENRSGIKSVKKEYVGESFRDGLLLWRGDEGDDCLEPGETRKLRIERTGGSADKTVSLTAEFYARQCRYDQEQGDNPWKGADPLGRAKGKCNPAPPVGPPCPVSCPADPCELLFDYTDLPDQPFGDKELSFIALCGGNLTDDDVTLNVTARNEDSEPTRLYWSVDNGKTVEQVTWKFGSSRGKGNSGGTFKREFPDGATSGSVYSDPTVGERVSKPPGQIECPDGTTEIKYEADERNDGLPTLEEKAGTDILPKIKEELNETDSIELDYEVLDRDELKSIEPVPDDPGSIDLTRRAYVGSTAGDERIVVDGDIDLSTFAALVGAVDAGGDIDLEKHAAIAGDVETTGDFDLDASTIVGDVTVDGGDVTITSTTAIEREVGTDLERELERELEGELPPDAKLSVESAPVTATISEETEGELETELEQDGDVSEKLEGELERELAVELAINTEIEVEERTEEIEFELETELEVEKELEAEIEREIENGLDAEAEFEVEVELECEVEIEAEIEEELEDDETEFEAEIETEIECEFDVEFGGRETVGSKVCGDVTTKNGGNVDIDSNALIDGDIDASGQIAGIRNSEVLGDVIAGRDGSDADVINSLICGDVSTGAAGGNIDIYEFSTIQGNVISDGVVDLQNSRVGGDVIAREGDLTIPSSIVCGDAVARDGSIDIDSTKTGPPKSDEEPRREERERSLVGGTVRGEGGDFDIDEATVFARDGVGVKITDPGNDSTITNDSVVKGAVEVTAEMNLDIDGGSRVEGDVTVATGTVSLSNVRIEGDVTIGPDGGKIDQLDDDATIAGTVTVKDGGTLDVSGPATIEGDLVIESGATANRGSVTVQGDVK